MASIYAELHVGGYVFPVRRYFYEFTQATDARGRVISKVRHSLLQLLLDVPDNSFLEDWVKTAYKPLPGYLVTYDANTKQAVETLSWEVGHGVGYEEKFQSGNAQEGSYVCLVNIASPQFSLRPGGPGTYVSPAPGEHGSPQPALVDPLRVPLLTPVPPLEELVLPSAEELAAGAAELALEAAVATAAAVAAPVALTLSLILASTTPAQAPGLHPHLPPPLSPDELRLFGLEGKYRAGTLTSNEEAELIALLGKVKGIHVQSLNDLDVRGPLRGDMVHLPGFHNVPLAYVKRTDVDREALRRKFDSSARKNFLKKIGADPVMQKQLKQAGFNDKQIARIASGKVPNRDWQVHHKLPIDDGGDNSFSNLMLIKNDPYHQAITNLQNSTTNGMQAGDTLKLQWPVYNGFIYPATKPGNN